MKVRILTEKELRRSISVNQEALAAIEEAFSWLAEGKATMPPIMHIEVPEYKGDVDIKSAYVLGLESFAVKLGAGFFENYRLGLPNSPAMMVVLSAKTGFAEAVLLDNAYLTDVRTGAAGAVVAKHLARASIESAGVIGAGAQGRYQMMGLKVVRDFKRLLAYDTDADRLAQYKQEMEPVLGVEVIAAADASEVVKESDAVVTSTPSRTPYLKPEWLHPGLHITAMGADLPDKQELDPEVLRLADLLVCDRKAQCFSMGELHHGLTTGILSEDSDITELGEITSGRAPGRQNDDQITLCDLTGTGVQDTAIACLALHKAIENGLGVEIDLGLP
ncbi:MAG: cyclodeaminase [Deltaproteobacteria bacterium]|nr:MAG: cyclodeaminase [Deltaproteobacteria bacterium]